jgi:hypothetical protein
MLQQQTVKGSQATKPVSVSIAAAMTHEAPQPHEARM